jgi:cytochrome c biogenesis protein CcmG, thiol:disulfide interchange protein DsbE
VAAEAPERSPLRLAGRIAAVLVAAAFVALLAYGLITKSPDRTVDDGLRAAGSVAAPALDQPVLDRGDLGQPLQARVGPVLARHHVSLAQLRGTPVVLNFWASWCDPCRAEAPVLQRKWLVERGRGVLFLGLNMQDITDDSRAFTRSVGATYPSLRDRSNGVAHRWGVTGLPETFFLSAQGRVVGHVIGAVSAEQLAAGVAAARAGRALGVQSGGERRKTR